MPTILLILGWRLFFYANERNEPIHVHCRKGNTECKFWLDKDNFEIEEAFSFNLSPRDKREIKKLFTNILNTLNNNGMNFKGENSNEKTS